MYFMGAMERVGIVGKGMQESKVRSYVLVLYAFINAHLVAIASIAWACDCRQRLQQQHYGHDHLTIAYSVGIALE